MPLLFPLLYLVMPGRSRAPTVMRHRLRFPDLRPDDIRIGLKQVVDERVIYSRGESSTAFSMRITTGTEKSDAQRTTRASPPRSSQERRVKPL